MKKYLLPLIFLLPNVVAAQSNTQHLKDSLRQVIDTSQGNEKWMPTDSWQMPVTQRL